MFPNTKRNGFKHAKRYQKKVRSAKEEKWKDLISSVMSDNESKIWSMIVTRSLEEEVAAMETAVR